MNSWRWVLGLMAYPFWPPAAYRIVAPLFEPENRRKMLLDKLAWEISLSRHGGFWEKKDFPYRKGRHFYFDRPWIEAQKPVYRWVSR